MAHYLHSVGSDQGAIWFSILLVTVTRCALYLPRAAGNLRYTASESVGLINLQHLIAVVSNILYGMSNIPLKSINSRGHQYATDHKLFFLWDKQHLSVSS